MSKSRELDEKHSRYVDVNKGHYGLRFGTAPSATPYFGHREYLCTRYWDGDQHSPPRQAPQMWQL